ncbi:MAG: hypothetical protein C0631_05445 [Sedimenticola sp.]|nr:MAG: hypothetical protein C0631_05445 [Sedimenticola sp.]
MVIAQGCAQPKDTKRLITSFIFSQAVNQSPFDKTFSGVTQMNPSKILASLLLLTASMHGHAWWGGPWTGMGDSWMDGEASFSIRLNSHSDFSHQGYRNQQPYYGYATAYPMEKTPVTLSGSELQAHARSQIEAMRRSIEAQRKLTEQFAASHR